jgi:hypothetical protein
VQKTASITAAASHALSPPERTRKEKAHVAPIAIAAQNVKRVVNLISHCGVVFGVVSRVVHSTSNGTKRLPIALRLFGVYLVPMDVPVPLAYSHATLIYLANNPRLPPPMRASS